MRSANRLAYGFGLIPAAVLALAGCSSKESPQNAPVSPSTQTTPPAAAAAPADATRQPPAGAQQSPQPGPSQSTDYAAARKTVEETIGRQPRDVSLRMKAAEFYMRAGDHAAAIPHLEAALKLDPKNLIGWIALGDAATFVGKFAQAQQAYDRAAKLDPPNPMINRGRGQLLVTQRKFKEARQFLEAGLAKHPEDDEIRTVLGNVYLILGMPRKTQEVVIPAAKREPDRPDLHQMLGDAYQRDFHIEAALKEFREVVRLNPQAADAWGKIGLLEGSLSRYKEARDPLEKAISLDPNESHYYWALGDTYLLESPNAQNFEKAEQLYRKALALDPKNDKALNSLGMALARRGKPKDLEEAVELFTRLSRLLPRDFNCEYKLYEANRRLGRTAEAARHKARYAALYATEQHFRLKSYASVTFKDTAEAHVKLGREAMSKHDYLLAVREFQLALQRDPRSAEAQAGLSQAQRMAGPGAASRAAPQ